jgi:hypothetical protein
MKDLDRPVAMPCHAFPDQKRAITIAADGQVEAGADKGFKPCLRFDEGAKLRCLAQVECPADLGNKGGVEAVRDLVCRDKRLWIVENPVNEGLKAIQTRLRPGHRKLKPEAGVKAPRVEMGVDPESQDASIAPVAPRLECQAFGCNDFAAGAEFQQGAELVRQVARPRGCPHPADRIGPCPPAVTQITDAVIGEHPPPAKGDAFLRDNGQGGQ